MSIPVGVVGTVANSDRSGYQVRVEEDRENTGGFFVFEWWDGSDGPNEHGAFDSWVETADHLQAYFQEAGWQVDWRQG